MKLSRLSEGDTVAVLAPASAPLDPDALRRGIVALENEGFHVECPRTSFDVFGYLSASDEQRLDELNTFLRRPDVKAVFCVRGGYGTLRLLPGVDYDAMRRMPKLLIGYSDITALQLAILKKTGVPSVSGPMIAVEWADLDPETAASFRNLVSGKAPIEVLHPDREQLSTVRAGYAEGLLIGGNLTLVVRLIGTPFLPDLAGAILFVEEVGEPPYRVDGLLAHLKLSGILERLGGLIFGGLTESDPEPGKPSLSMEQVMEDYARDVSYPVVRNLSYGHFPRKSSLPIGIRARLEAETHRASLTILESLVD